MNKDYNKISPKAAISAEMVKTLAQKEIQIPSDIPHGDMPGDKIEIGESHIAKAKTVFPKLLEELSKVTTSNPYGRAVITVCGGSGVGKSEIASLLSYMLEQSGIGSYTMSGDNYPHRIPMYNDAERLHTFRQSGIRGMVDGGAMNAENYKIVKNYQELNDDANADHVKEYPWFASYLDAGKKGLDAYLGTPNETDFDEVDSILAAFKDGADKLWLKRMGRDESTLWYDEVDMTDKQVLIIEWTHGNTDFMKEVDIPVLLNSTPQETLEHRRSRARDGKVDSPFTMMVLELEQNKLMAQAHKAKIIVSKQGEIISYDDYKKLMGL
ncbi:adenylylsulfate kinase [Butyrivibrio sp. JL13D10]|uniref:adenylylsulfate kinase n=1 Tax=Butyrivibrio sp. JL13D10 TaxID=3236815 RepID=UPI0038B66007